MRLYLPNPAKTRIEHDSRDKSGDLTIRNVFIQKWGFLRNRGLEIQPILDKAKDFWEGTPKRTKCLGAFNGEGREYLTGFMGMFWSMEVACLTHKQRHKVDLLAENWEIVTSKLSQYRFGGGLRTLHRFISDISRQALPDGSWACLFIVKVSHKWQKVILSESASIDQQVGPISVTRKKCYFNHGFHRFYPLDHWGFAKTRVVTAAPDTDGLALPVLPALPTLPTLPTADAGGSNAESLRVDTEKPVWISGTCWGYLNWLVVWNIFNFSIYWE